MGLAARARQITGLKERESLVICLRTAMLTDNNKIFVERWFPRQSPLRVYFLATNIESSCLSPKPSLFPATRGLNNNYNSSPSRSPVVPPLLHSKGARDLVAFRFTALPLILFDRISTTVPARLLLSSFPAV